MSAILDIAGLHIEAHDRTGVHGILRGVDLSIGEGTVHGLVGESGAGKSMLCRAVLGVMPDAARVSAGRISFCGADILGLDAAARRGLAGAISLIPQDPQSALNPAFRIGTQMTALLRRRLGLDARAAAARALDLLERVQLRDPATVVRQYPHQLSGGMRQRILIALAFGAEPRLIVADEPTTALDVTVQREILRLLRALQRDTGVAVLFVSHDLGVVANVCDRVSVMHAGRILESAPAAQLFAAPASPYTRALLTATPRHDRPADALRPIDEALLRQLHADALAYDEARHLGGEAR